MSFPREVLLVGGAGRLGRRLPCELGRLGMAARAPARRTLDPVVLPVRNLRAAVAGHEVVVSCAAYADVPGCDREPARCTRDNVEAASALAVACREERVPLLWIGSDYATAGRRYDGPAGSESVLSCLPPPPSSLGLYALSKWAAEAPVLGNGGNVARVAFADPADAARWAWVDGYNVASREWVERTAARVAMLARMLAASGPGKDRVAGRVFHLGPVAGIDDGELGPWRTRAEMLASRFPGHPALARIVRSGAERRALGANEAPRDTRFDACDQRLSLAHRDDLPYP